MFKKGFTLIELILTLVLMSMISTYAIKEYLNSQLNSAVLELQDTVLMIVNDGIMSHNGYASATGTPVIDPTNDNGCSPTYLFDNLSSTRLHQCLNWTASNRFQLSSNKIVGKGLLDEYGGCSVDVQAIANPSEATTFDRFDIYVDCSNASVETKKIILLEDALNYVFEVSLSDATQIIYRNATNLTTVLANANAGTGNPNDGKIRARLVLW